jgi:hypothetical protein
MELQQNMWSYTIISSYFTSLLFFGFLLHYPLYFLIVLVNVVLSFLFHSNLLFSEQLYALLSIFAHLLKRRSCLRIAFAVVHFIVFLYFFPQKLIFVVALYFKHFFVCFLLSFFVSFASENILIVDSKAKFSAYLYWNTLRFVFLLVITSENAKLSNYYSSEFSDWSSMSLKILAFSLFLCSLFSLILSSFTIRFLN